MKSPRSLSSSPSSKRQRIPAPKKSGLKKKPSRSPASAPPVLPLFNWLQKRSAGVLLHPTSLPGAHGIGTFDENLTAFLDLLKSAGVTNWQICPLGPTGYGDSPYQCFSAFAGNPLVIDLAVLAGAGLLTPEELAPLAALPADRVDYGALFRLKWPLLFTAHRRYLAQKSVLPYGDFAAFKSEQAGWLDAYCYFRALKDHFGGTAWQNWPADLRQQASARRSPLRERLAPAIDAHAFTQYLFFGQWAQVRAAAQARSIQIIGDLPIFVAGDSADAWAAPHLFELDPQTGRPLAVAGVPPDYFSKDGQLWGNPLYRWKVHATDGYKWWLSRLAASFALYDIVRIDHFRGFDACWRIAWPAKTARRGVWTPGPGLDLFKAIRRRFPAARIIAEDLGVLTDSVRALLRDTGLPGMLVLQFAFGGDATNPYLPHQHPRNAAVYPGTHDNDTTLGWYRALEPRTRDQVHRYLRISGAEIPWDFLRSAYVSPARLAVIPFTDLLSLGTEARFNSPGRAEDNWQWRCTRAQLDSLAGPTAAYLRELAALYDR
jgi:4-alpha-glucanotransferase